MGNQKRGFINGLLVTAIVMMLTASGFIYIQTRGYAGQIVVDLDAHIYGDLGVHTETRAMSRNLAWDPGTSYGWPFCFFHAGRYKSQLIPVPAILQLLLFVISVVLAAALCEWLVRRREPRHSDTGGKQVPHE